MDSAESRGYRALVVAIPAFVVAYTALMLLLPRIGIHGEQYLLYSWFVFPTVPLREEVTYEAYLRAPREERLETSGAFLRDELRNVPEYRRRVIFIGTLMAQGQDERAAQERRALESFALERPLTYEIVEVRYNPIERFRSGSTLATSSLGLYTVAPL